MYAHIDLLQLESYGVSLLLPTASPGKVILLDEDGKYIQYSELHIMNLFCRHVFSSHQAVNSFCFILLHSQHLFFFLLWNCYFSLSAFYFPIVQQIKYEGH